jgi:anti-sigma factor (TIGR02949 family)
MAGGPNCREALALLQDYLKQELTPDLEEKITQHLQKCRPCFTNLQFERGFLEMLERKAKGQCCPDQLRRRILAHLHDLSDA